MKSGTKLVIVMTVIFLPVLAVAISSIASRIPPTARLSVTFIECVEGCPSARIWVANASGWTKLTLQVAPSSIEANCLMTSPGNVTGCTRYVEFSDDGQHWRLARVAGPQTVCYGGGLNCVCCLHDYIEFPVFDPLTMSFPVQGRYVGITGVNDTGISVFASR